MLYAWIAIGGALGALTRYELGKRFQNRLRPFPFATLACNLPGAFLLGLLIPLHSAGILPDMLWYAVGPGFCGAFTTFSALGFETFTLLAGKRCSAALFYVSLTLVFGFAAVWLGTLIPGLFPSLLP